ncbi:MAG: ISAzo13 family transposase, partial [Actinobacteria bacterium]|nr:ISAzo13 family transposase [Actinomycetota bacterium]
IELISATTTTTGLAIQAAHDPNWYPTGVQVTDAELGAVPLSPHDWHGDWNYTINAQSDVA